MWSQSTRPVSLQRSVRPGSILPYSGSLGSRFATYWRYYDGTLTAAIPSRLLRSSLAHRYLVVALSFAPDAAKGLTPPHQAWRFFPAVTPAPPLFYQGVWLLSQVPEFPLCVLALLFDPGRSLVSPSFDTRNIAYDPRVKSRLPATILISGLNCTALTLASPCLHALTAHFLGRVGFATDLRTGAWVRWDFQSVGTDQAPTGKQ